MVTALELTSEDVERYRRTAQDRNERERANLVVRERRAWALAHEAAELLRNQVQAQRVVVFGSLIHPGCFTEWSDVDIVAWGIAPQDTWLAAGLVMDLSEDVEINLVDVSTCSASLLSVIERESVPL